MDKIALHLYHSEMAFESRIMKEAKSLADSGMVQKIFIIGIQKNNLPEFENLDSVRSIWRVPLITRILSPNTILKTIEWFEWLFKILIRFKSERVLLVSCDSLVVLPIGTIFKLWKDSNLVYSVHELETEMANSKGFRKIFARILEGLLIHCADEVIVVSDSISDWYKKRYRVKNIEVIRNIPNQNSHEIGRSDALRKKFNIRDQDLLFVYLGLLSDGRGINLLLEAFTKCYSDRHLVFMGYGPLKNKIEEYESRYPNIHFHHPVKAEQIGYYISGADIGVCLIENVSLSYYYSLPNKFFEYLLSGLPIIASDFPEMAGLIDNYDCGWKVAVKIDSIINLINEISTEEVNKKRENILKCREKFSWQNEGKKLIQIYSALIKH